MRKFKLFLLIVIGGAIAISMMGCGQVADIPGGYIGKVLTPTGWENKLLEAGQVDIGDESNNGSCNKLVICEATSVTIKESFSKNGDKGEDHRIITTDKVPLTVDLYTQVMVPEEKKMRDSIFAQVTPIPTKMDRVSKITLEMIYDRFARMTIRGKTRQIFSKYKNYDRVMANYDQINKEVSAMIIDTFQQTKIPLRLLGGQLSNVKVDGVVLDALNEEAAAKARANAITIIGAAIRANPGYLEKYKWDKVLEITDKNPKMTLIVNDGAGGSPVAYVPRR